MIARRLALLLCLALLSASVSLSCLPFGTRPKFPVLSLSGRKLDFHGWRDCYELTNGLITVTLAPSLGGRVLQYRLGNHSFFFLGREELGRTYRDRGFRRYHFFGGSYLQLHPEERWGSTGGSFDRAIMTDYPPHFYMGNYQLRTADIRPARAVVELTGPYPALREKQSGKAVVVEGDPATGVLATTRLEAYPYTTRLGVTHTIQNLSDKPQLWGVWEVTQLRGNSEESGILSLSDVADGSSWLYLPTSAASRFKNGFLDLLAGQPVARESEKQWMPGLVPHVLAVQYLGRLGKVGVDVPSPWAAFVDQGRQLVFVVRGTTLQGQYPDGGCTLEVLTHGGPRAYPILEVNLFGPAVELGPGGKTSATFQWAAATCPPPIRDASDLGVVSEPLSLSRQKTGWQLRGTFGVFYWAHAYVFFLDQKDTVIGKLHVGRVTPFEPIVLHDPVDIPAGTRSLSLSLYSVTNRKIGDLDRAELPGVP